MLYSKKTRNVKPVYHHLTPLFTLEDLWAEVGFSPNLQQRQAILHTEGALFLTAGPGSGKTRVLLWRTLNLLVFKQVSPEHIFLATFTEKAALQLKEGLQNLLGIVTNKTNHAYDLSKMYIGTVHSLCIKLMNDRRFGTKTGRNKVPKPLDEIEQYFHVSFKENWNKILEAGNLDKMTREEAHDFINQYLNPTGKEQLSRFDAINNLIGFFNRLSEEYIDTKQLLAQNPDNEHTPFLKMYQTYLDTLQEPLRDKFDFALMQAKGLQILENHIGETFKYVIVDEYQDTNAIQEKLYFKLAEQTKNFCVVGDDDQALYRFRGATVENFVEFPARCQQYLQTLPTQIPLSTNYRSRAEIVDYYTQYINQTDWQKADKTGYYRVTTKNIQAHSQDKNTAVVVNEKGKGVDGTKESFAQIARLIKKLLAEKKIEDPNQVAFLFSSLRSEQVTRAKDALENEGLKVYAPRAQPFLELEEARIFLGIFLTILGGIEYNPDFAKGDFARYQEYLQDIQQGVKALCKTDAGLAKFIQEKQNEIADKIRDFKTLLGIAGKLKWDINAQYDYATMHQYLNEAELSKSSQETVSNTYFAQQIQENKFTTREVFIRATSLDWNPLDIFYRALGFKVLKDMLDKAEKGAIRDEGPAYNLGLLSQYLAKFVELYGAIIKADSLDNQAFKQAFFTRYFYTLYKMGETEFENPDDPFPRGRVPFLTIHQSKGLEFPVVVLGNTSTGKDRRLRTEEIINELLHKKGEPIEKMNEFDRARKFYVALSRAENLLVLTNYAWGTGDDFQELLQKKRPAQIAQFDTNTLPTAHLADKNQMKAYSYTADYLVYERCPRQYMMFRKYGFEASRSQTMFFGNLVHQTIDDLHNYLIQERLKANA